MGSSAAYSDITQRHAVRLRHMFGGFGRGVQDMLGLKGHVKDNVLLSFREVLSVSMLCLIGLSSNRRLQLAPHCFFAALAF
jgi:hypothetical protein